MKWIIAAAIIYIVWRYLRPTRKQVPTRLYAQIADEAEARAILGVGMDADDVEIRAAHRKLVATVHPDRGGSPDEARRVNAARDLLLRRNG